MTGNPARAGLTAFPGSSKEHRGIAASTDNGYDRKTEKYENSESIGNRNHVPDDHYFVGNFHHRLRK